ncbi:hypothetical protein [Peribacillus simplex]|uniref:hypothetical protein n=1 Tax=Peribacillus simplex TaxID=1478 RepID=UPI003D2DC026
MYRKNCHTCHRASFSSGEYGEWLCPTCGEDLTVQKAHGALTIEKNQYTPTKYYEEQYFTII